MRTHRYHYGMSRKVLSIACVALMQIGLGSSITMAIDIGNPQWGFDGRVVEKRITLLSVEVTNTSETPFDAPLYLQKTLNTQSLGARIQKNIFVGPYETRLIQFYPYIIDSSEQWYISWDSQGGGRIQVPRPSLDFPATVYLMADDELTLTKTSLRRMPESQFPSLVNATDGLGTVVMDRMPRWQEPRRKTFMQWLRAGGRVHIFQVEGNDEFPIFIEELSELNSVLESFPVGAGQVIRHAKPLSGLSRQEVDNTVIDPKILAAMALEAEKSSVVGNALASDRFERANGVEHYFKLLRNLSVADHSWGLIHLLSLCYLGIIFPGCFLIGRKANNFRIPLAAMLGTVALFSLLFGLIGRRGYGESTQVHSLTIAHAVGDSIYDVTQWNNLFVTAGGDFTIQFDSEASIMSSAQQIEAVNGIIQNGVNGNFVVDVPPFSSRSFIHRGRFNAPTIKLGIEKWQELDNRGSSQLKSFVLKVDESFPADVHEMYVVHGNVLYMLNRVEDELRLQTGVGKLTGGLQFDLDQGLRRRVSPFARRRDATTAESRFRRSGHALISHGLGITDRFGAATFQVESGQAIVCILAPMTEKFQVKNPDLVSQTGYVLYRIDLVRPAELPEGP